MSTNLDMAKGIFGEVFEWMNNFYWNTPDTRTHSFDEIKDAYIAAEKKFNNSSIEKDVTTVCYLTEIEELFKIIANQDEEERAIEQIRVLTKSR